MSSKKNQPSFIASVVLYGLLLFIWLLQGQTYPGGLLDGFVALRHLSYIIIALIVPVYFCLFVVTKRTRILLGGGVFQFGILLTLYIILVGLYQNTPLIKIIEGIFVYLKYIILYVTLLLLSNKTTIVNFLRFFIFVTTAICVEAIVNYLFLGLQHDYTYLTLGPWGGHVTAGVLLLYACCLVMANMFIAGVSKYHIIFAFMVVIASIIASNRGTIIFLAPLVMMIFFIRKNILKPKLVYFFSLGLNVMVLLVSVQFYRSSEGLDITHCINPIYRLNYIGCIFDILQINGDLFFGNGIRCMKPGLDGSGGEIYTILSDNYKSLLVGGTNQYVKALAELGLVGTMLYWLMLAKVLANNIIVWTSIRGRNYMSSFDKTVSLSFFAIWLHFSAIGLFYNDFWRFDASALIFWVIALYIYFVKTDLERVSLYV